MPKRKSSDCGKENNEKKKLKKASKPECDEPPRKTLKKTATEVKTRPTTSNSSKPKKISSHERITWPESDLIEFVNKVEEAIPEDDSMSYSSRLEKLNWELLAFNNYSVKECKEVWNILQTRVRKYRILKEIVIDVKQWITETPKKAAKANVFKHPDMPKHPYNSFMIFADENRAKVQIKYPTLRSVDVARKLGEIFNQLPDKEREHYKKLAEVAREKYNEELQEFYEQHPELIPKKSSKKAKGFEFEKGRGPPNKPKTPFELFVSTEQEKEGELSRSDLLNKCKGLWHDMSDGDKMFYLNWACEEFKKYEDDVKEYVKNNPQYQPEKLKTILTKKEIEIKERMSGKPTKPPHAAYQLFTKIMSQNEEVSNLNAKDTMNYISEKWKACSEEEKNEYKVRVTQMWEAYHVKFEKYLKTFPPEERDEIIQKEGKKKPGPSVKKVKISEAVGVKLRKPKAPPLTAYKYFVSVYRGKSNPARVWRKMSDEEHKVYKEGLALSKQNYIALYEQYLKSMSKEELEQFGKSLTDEDNDSSSETLGSSDSDSN